MAGVGELRSAAQGDLYGIHVVHRMVSALGVASNPPLSELSHPSHPYHPAPCTSHLSHCPHGQGWYAPHTLSVKPHPSPKKYLPHRLQCPPLLPSPFTDDKILHAEQPPWEQALVARLWACRLGDRRGTTAGRLSPSRFNGGSRRGKARGRVREERTRLNPPPRPLPREGEPHSLPGATNPVCSVRVRAALACLAQILWSAFPGLHPSWSTTHASCLRVRPILLATSVAPICHTSVSNTLFSRRDIPIYKRHLQHQLESCFPSQSRASCLPLRTISFFHFHSACHAPPFRHFLSEHSSYLERAIQHTTHNASHIRFNTPSLGT